MYTILRISTLTILALFLSQTTVFSQEEATEDTIIEAPVERPVRPAFESGLLFDAATTTLYPSKTLEMIIQHRFGVINFCDDNTDFLGIWGASNIRIGMNYSILKNLTVGVGATKYNKMEDLQIKYRVIEQTRSNSVPVTVVLYGVAGIDGSEKTKFDVTAESDTAKYKFSNRLNYFAQIIVSRRFNDHLSLQIAPGFTHYNCINKMTVSGKDTSYFDHDRISLSFAGRYKFSPQGSFILSADFPFKIQGISEHSEANSDNVFVAKPNISVGFEISTSTHAFHLYLANSQGILPQEGIMWNRNNFFEGQFLIGLNITRLWNF
jgi:hypothetical protein